MLQDEIPSPTMTTSSNIIYRHVFVGWGLKINANHHPASNEVGTHSNLKYLYRMAAVSLGFYLMTSSKVRSHPDLFIIINRLKSLVPVFTRGSDPPTRWCVGILQWKLNTKDDYAEATPPPSKRWLHEGFSVVSQLWSRSIVKSDNHWK